MFLNKTCQTNPELIKASFDLHQKHVILPDTYVVDMDTLKLNANKIINEANKQNVDLYFMLKQIGRNPIIAKELVKLGYKGAVVVDFKEAKVMMNYNIPIANVGHLVQPPKCMLQELVDYGCDYFTVFSIDKISNINECAAKSGKTQKILLKVVGQNDIIYSGQTAGFRLEILPEMIEKIKKYKNVEIKGITSFPCFLYNEESGKIEPTANFKTLQEAKQILEEHGIEVENVNAPSTTSVETLKAMHGYGVNSGEPGHGLTGTTPLHATENSVEIPCVTYVSEVSHNFDELGYCYGGGFYRRSHVKNALVGKTLENAKNVEVIPPSLESIDYYFGLSEECEVNDTVVMAFRFQIFVTRSSVCLVEGISNKQPKCIGIYNSLGDENFEK